MDPGADGRCLVVGSRSCVIPSRSHRRVPAPRAHCLDMSEPPRSLLALASLLLVPAAALAQPVPAISIPGPVGPPLDGPGQGMCMASAIVERNAQGQFEIAFGTLDDTNYDPTINSFMEQRVDERIEYVVRTPLDLSNNNLADPLDQTSLGDFRSVAAACPPGGCGFFINDTSTAFASRLRGLFNVTAELAGQPLHIGFYADDSVNLTIYNKDSNTFKVMTRPPQIGSPTWRLTQAVIFQEPGLYPVEILYTQITEHAALEMSYFIGTFQDFEREAAQDPVVQLDDASFTPFQPVLFFQAISGSQSFPDPDQCLQCNRQFANMAGNNGCPGGYYCNEAALCAPCDTALFCGPTCSPCGGTTPFCINRNGQNVCVECEADRDCEPGYQCDPGTNTCFECNKDEDCDRGEFCDLADGACKVCAADGQCAGSSCNCCPAGAMGPAMRCEAVEPGGPPVCIECTSDAECADGWACDPVIFQCVEGLVSHRDAAACGSNLEQCTPERPFCVQSSDQMNASTDAACAACRWDLDCPDGSYCDTGDCVTCDQDRRCGARCTSCGGDTPYCLAGNTADASQCVGCVEDWQCESGECDVSTHTCTPVCIMSCGEGTHCYGDACVECYADTHCGCDGTCDTSTLTCLSSCKNNKDCQGNQHCRLAGGGGTECAPGPVPSDVLCARPLAAGCNGQIGRGAPASPWAMLALLAGLLGLRARRRPRRQTVAMAPRTAVTAPESAA
jgi:outer membrane exchange protein TraA